MTTNLYKQKLTCQIGHNGCRLLFIIHSGFEVESLSMQVILQKA
jgi:hypothetical protein